MQRDFLAEQRQRQAEQARAAEAWRVDPDEIDEMMLVQSSGAASVEHDNMWADDDDVVPEDVYADAQADQHEYAFLGPALASSARDSTCASSVFGDVENQSEYDMLMLEAVAMAEEVRRDTPEPARQALHEQRRDSISMHSEVEQGMDLS